MKRPVINQDERYWAIKAPNALFSIGLDFEISKLRFKREFDKTLLMKAIYLFVDWLEVKLKRV